jgi:hypothetical protein
MTTIAINTFFQSQTASNCDVTLTIDELLAAADAVSTAQEPVIEARAGVIMKAIVKDKQLWVRPTVAQFAGQDFLVSGRHRVTALARLASLYYVNAVNAVLPIPEGGIPEGGVAITPIVNCDVVVCQSMRAVAKLQESFNGSRSMTAAEKMLVKQSFSKLTPTELAKQSLARKLQAAIGVTFQTGLAIATRLSSKVKTFIYATDDQLTALAEIFQDYIAANPTNVPSNMAREYGTLVDAVIYAETEGFNAEGEVVNMSVIESWASDVTKPEKVLKSAKNETSEKLALAMAKLAELGYTI